MAENSLMGAFKMSEEAKTFQFFIEHMWVPAVTWVMACTLRLKQDNKERDVKIQELKEDIAVAKATHITREEVMLIIDGRISGLEEKLDKISDEITTIIRSLPSKEID